jgi:hypothetical protein
MEMEPQKVEPFLSHRHQAGLGRVELEFQLLEDHSDRVERVLGLEFGPADHDHVIGIPAQFAQTGIARDPVHIQHVQVNVRQQGAGYTSYKVAHHVVAFSTRLPRAPLRPRDGAGLLGALRTLVTPDAIPTERERGGRHGTSRPAHDPGAGGQRPG